MDKSTADLILCNASVLTFDPEHARASLVAIKDGRIIGVTDDEAINEFRGSASQVIDCSGLTVLPGLIDAHCHLVALAKSLLTPSLDRNTVRSIGDIQAVIERLAHQITAGEWIQATGYDEFYLIKQHHPTSLDLDKATTSHPVALTHRTGRAHVLNSLALKLAGINRETSEPPGGMIERDLTSGEPSGLLYGMSDYLSKVVPPIKNSRLEEGIKIASQELLAAGVTSIHEASPHNDLQRWQALRQWKAAGHFKPRVSMMLGVNAFRQYQRTGLLPRIGDDQLHLGAVKIIVDRTRGRLNPTQQELTQLVYEVHSADFQAAFHAIEEPEIDAACNAIEQALLKLPKADHRHRIEHCSVCPTKIARRLASNNITVVTHPSFVYYNGERYLQKVPEQQLKYLYPIASLIKSGIKVAAGSDFPVVSPEPLTGIYAAVSRKTDEGSVLLASEKVSVPDALWLYNVGGAYADFTDHLLGSLVPGKLADLILLNGDPLTIDPEEIKSLEVKMTVIGGEIVWRRGF